MRAVQKERASNQSGTPIRTPPVRCCRHLPDGELRADYRPSGRCGSCLRDAFEKAGEQPRGNRGIVSKLRIIDELVAHPDGRAMQRVVGSSGELDEAAPLEALAIGRPHIAEIGAMVVKVERVAAGRGVEVALAFADAGANDAVSARIVASAIRIIGLSASCGSTSAFSTNGRFVSMLARGALGSIPAATSTVMSGIRETIFIAVALEHTPAWARIVACQSAGARLAGAEKGQNPLAHARGSEFPPVVCRCLLSRDREGVGPERPLLGSC